MKGSAVADEAPPTGETTPETSPTAGDAPEQSGDDRGGDQEPETFDRAYVQKLRDEAAANRVKAKRADEAETRLRTLSVEAATRGVLQDPTDLAWSDDLNDEDGWPDHDKIRAAAEALAEKKPHLGRPAGDVGQGRHSEDEDTVSLSGLLRAGA